MKTNQRLFFIVLFSFYSQDKTEEQTDVEAGTVQIHDGKDAFVITFLHVLHHACLILIKGSDVMICVISHRHVLYKNMHQLRREEEMNNKL